MMDFGIQLYSIRDMAEADFEKTLYEVASLGYKSVETAGFFGHSAETVKKWLDKYGLAISGAHGGFEDLKNDFEEIVRYHKTIGNRRYIIPVADCRTKNDVDMTVDAFNRFCPLLRENGIELGFHNHDAEFRLNDEGICPMEYLKNNTSVNFEIDTFWVYAAGYDPVRILEEYRNRSMGIIHLKDGCLEPEFRECALGEGHMPLGEIIRKASASGWEIIVESEGLQPTGLDEITRCADYLSINPTQHRR